MKKVLRTSYAQNLFYNVILNKKPKYSKIKEGHGRGTEYGLYYFMACRTGFVYNN